MKHIKTVLFILALTSCVSHKSVIERRKECNCEIVRWQTELRDGKLTQDEYDDLVSAQKELTQNPVK